VAWEKVERVRLRLRTVFTGELLQVRAEDARRQSPEAYIVRGTYIANTSVIGTLHVPWKSVKIDQGADSKENEL
jgi:hypothetical protein